MGLASKTVFTVLNSNSIYYDIQKQSRAVSAACIDDQCLEIQLETLMGSVGEKKAIYCEGTNIKPMEMEWYSPDGTAIGTRSSKNNRVYVEGRKEKESDKGLLVLIIFSLQMEDHGNWTCKGKKLELSDSIDVTVGVKASVDRPSETKIEQAGANVKMNCTAKGVPTPTVQWYDKEMQLIEKGANPRLVISQSRDTHFLLIKNVDYADSGTYLCKATQKRLTHYAHKLITLEVQHEPIIFDPDTQRPVDIQRKGKGEEFALKEIFVVANETKVITCNAIANPLPTFKWYIIRDNNFNTHIRDEELIKSDTFSSNLTVILREADDDNKFKCVAVNDLGKASLVYHITLGDPPNPPDDIKFVSANHTYINFDVPCNNCSLFDKKTEGVKSPDPYDLPIKGYSFQLVAHQAQYPADWENAEEFQVEIENPNITIFSVGPLANSTTYHVRVRSYNDAGFSDWLEMDATWLESTKTDSATQLAATVLLLLATVLLVTKIC